MRGSFVLFILIWEHENMTAIPAYIDPGTGSLIWQSIAAAFIGAMFYARRIVAKVKSWIGKD